MLVAFDPKTRPFKWTKCTKLRASSLWMSMRHSWMVESHSLVSWQKAISSDHFQRNTTFGVIYTVEGLW